MCRPDTFIFFRSDTFIFFCQVVASVDDIHRILAEWPIGKPLPVTVIRGEERIEVSVEPAEVVHNSGT